MNNNNTAASWTPLRQAEKKYKLCKGKKGEPTDLKDPKWNSVIDFLNIDKNTAENNALIVKVELQSHPFEKQFSAYSIKGYEGFYFIPNPLTDKQQIHWITQSLQAYTPPPNSNNLNPFHGILHHLFDRALLEYVSHHPHKYAHLPSNLLSSPSPSPLSSDANISTTTPPTTSTTNTSTSTTASNSSDDSPYSTTSPSSSSTTSPITSPLTATELLGKLRWVTLGFQYDWTNRTYPSEKHFPFPPDLSHAATHLARSVGSDIVPQAAIINFYVQDSTLGCHLDDVEEDMEHPIVSMSFGNMGVFLLGGENKEIPPIAMYVRSGDVMIMGGRSRKCYHGVPRIFAGTCPQFNIEDENKDEKASVIRDFVLDFLSHTRININIRQVFKNSKE